MKSLEELQALRDQVQRTIGIRADDSKNTRVVVAMGTCGIAAGARQVLHTFTEEAAKHGLMNVTVMQTGCIGLCPMEPVVEITVPGKPKATYIRMTPEKAVQVVESHIIKGKPVTEYMIGAAKQ